MVKLEINKIDKTPKVRVDFYDHINRIPFTVFLGDYLSLPSTIYARNINRENFIEFRFEADEKKLYEISLVSFQRNAVINTSSASVLGIDNLDFYSCKIIENKSVLKDSIPMEITRYNDAVLMEFKGKRTAMFFRIGNNCFVGISEDFFLNSILLNELSSKNVLEIFGY